MFITLIPCPNKLAGSVSAAILSSSCILWPGATDDHRATKSVTTVFEAAVHITAVAPGPYPLAFQWQLDDANLMDNSRISGSLSSVLTLSNINFGDAGGHTLIAKNLMASASTMSASLGIVKGTPLVNWTEPVVITYGTALGANQLNATANVSGTFSFNPSVRMVLKPGTNTLTASITPSDRVDYYSNVTSSVCLAVLKAPLSLTASNVARSYGQTAPIILGNIVGRVNGNTITQSNSYFIQVSSNLQSGTWQSFCSNTITTGGLTYLLDSNVTMHPRSFYRAVPRTHEFCTSI